MLKTITHVCLYVANMERSVAFYRDVLGLKPLPKHTTPNFFAFDAGGVMLGLEPNGVGKKGEKTKAENPVLLQFRADSLDHLENMNRRLESHGVQLTNRSHQMSYGTITNFLDPDGNKLEILFQTKQ